MCLCHTHTHIDSNPYQQPKYEPRKWMSSSLGKAVLVCCELGSAEISYWFYFAYYTQTHTQTKWNGLSVCVCLPWMFAEWISLWFELEIISSQAPSECVKESRLTFENVLFLLNFSSNFYYKVTEHYEWLLNKIIFSTIRPIWIFHPGEAKELSPNLKGFPPPFAHSTPTALPSAASFGKSCPKVISIHTPRASSWKIKASSTLSFAGKLLFPGR